METGAPSNRLAGEGGWWFDTGMSGPPPVPPDWTEQRDSEHLRLLGIFYYVSAGLTGFGALFGLVYVVLGVVIGGVALADGQEEAVVMGVIFGATGLFTVLLCGVMILLEVMAGRKLMAARGRTFCMVVAAFNCLSFPTGTALGVFTFIVLSRPSVQARFALADAGRADQGARNA